MTTRLRYYLPLTDSQQAWIEPLKKRKNLENKLLSIEKLSHEGRGIAHHEGKVAFVFGALPGEKADTRFFSGRRRYLEGVAESILDPNPNRVQPLCPHFGLCGGCMLQHLSPEAQIKFKEEVLLEQLASFGKVTPHQIFTPLVSDPWHYRTKARLGVKFVIKKDRMLIGFHEQKNAKVADLEQCPVLTAKGSALMVPFRTLVQSLEAFDTIPQLEVAVGEGITAFIVRHMAPLSAIDEQALVAFAKAHDIWLYLQPKGPETVHKIWPEDNQVYLSYALPQEDLRYEFHPNDFTQVNPAMNALMVARAMALLEIQPAENILDLFCGLGNFSLPMAKRGSTVTGVEGSLEMAQRAQHNAALNQITNTSFYAANLYEPIEAFDWAHQKYDKILIDPPRSGAEPLLPWLSKQSAKKMLYVSCNPATLARDVGLCVHEFGWTLEGVGVMDMFPHTKHVEAMALLVRK